MKDLENLKQNFIEVVELAKKVGNENDKLKVQLANAIKCLIRDDVFVSMEGLLIGLGMSEKEYMEIMGE